MGVSGIDFYYGMIWSDYDFSQINPTSGIPYALHSESSEIGGYITTEIDADEDITPQDVFGSAAFDGYGFGEFRAVKQTIMQQRKNIY